MKIVKDDFKAKLLALIVNSTKSETKCDVCDKILANKGFLKSHKQIHKDERARKYEFTECDAKFFRPQGFKYHIATHQNRKRDLNV